MKYSYNGKSDELKTFFPAPLKISVFPSKISFALQMFIVTYCLAKLV